MMLLDSPLNKVGLLEILLENSDGKIIEVNPDFRIPRTWKVFAKVIGKQINVEVRKMYDKAS